MKTSTRSRAPKHRLLGGRKTLPSAAGHHFMPPMLRSPKSIPVPACWLDEETGAVCDRFSSDALQRAVDDLTHATLH